MDRQFTTASRELGNCATPYWDDPVNHERITHLEVEQGPLRVPDDEGYPVKGQSFQGNYPMYRKQKATVNEPYIYYNWKPMKCADCDNYDRAFFKSYDPEGVNWKELDGQYKCPTDIECMTCNTEVNKIPLGVTKPSLLRVKKDRRFNFKLPTPQLDKLQEEAQESADTVKTVIVSSVMAFIIMLLMMFVL